MPGRIWWVRSLWALCCLWMLAGACTSAATVVAAPAQEPTVETGQPAAELVQDEPDDPGEGIGVPFPPSENLVEYDEIVLGDGIPSAAELAAHPLAAGILDPTQIEHAFGGQWALTWAQPVEQDFIPASDADSCTSNEADRAIPVEGLDLSYNDDAVSSLELNLRRGPEVQSLFGALRSFVDCAFSPDVFPERTTTGQDGQTRFARTTIDTSSGQAYFNSFLMVHTGDLLVAISINAESETEAAANEQRLDEVVATILALLGS